MPDTHSTSLRFAHEEHRPERVEINNLESLSELLGAASDSGQVGQVLCAEFFAEVNALRLVS